MKSFGNGFRCCERGNPSESMPRSGLGVHAKIHGAGRLIAGLMNQRADGFIPSAVGICKVPYRDAEGILKGLPAVAELPAHFPRLPACQVGMGEAVGSDPVPLGDPFADLSRIHQRNRDFAVPRIPAVRAADLSGDKELNGSETIAPEGLHGILNDASASVIEGDDDFPFGIALRDRSRKIVKKAGSEAGGPEFLHLHGKNPGRSEEERFPGSRRRSLHAVISQNGDSLKEERFLSPAEKKPGGDGFEHDVSGMDCGWMKTPDTGTLLFPNSQQGSLVSSSST